MRKQRRSGDGRYYDAAGNRTLKTKGTGLETWEYHYDHLNHLTYIEGRTSSGGGGTLISEVSYTYDVFGNRIARDQWDGVPTAPIEERFAYDGWKVQQDFLGSRPSFVGQENWDVWGDFTTSMVLDTRRMYGDGFDDMVNRVSGTDVFWYHADTQGSITALTNAAGASVNTITYDGYGEATETNASAGDRYGYTGREEDVGGLMFYRDRVLAMDLGQFITRDRKGFAAGDMNLVRYVGNGFVNGVDPSGNVWIVKGNSQTINRLTANAWQEWLAKTDHDGGAPAVKDTEIVFMGDGSYLIDVDPSERDRLYDLMYMYSGKNSAYAKSFVDAVFSRSKAVSLDGTSSVSDEKPTSRGPGNPSILKQSVSAFSGKNQLWHMKQTGQLAEFDGDGDGKLNDDERVSAFLDNYSKTGTASEDDIGYREFMQLPWAKMGLEYVYLATLIKYGDEGAELLDKANRSGITIKGDGGSHYATRSEFKHNTLTIAEDVGAQFLWMSSWHSVDGAAEKLMYRLRENRAELVEQIKFVNSSAWGNLERENRLAGTAERRNDLALIEDLAIEAVSFYVTTPLELVSGIRQASTAMHAVTATSKVRPIRSVSSVAGQTLAKAIIHKREKYCFDPSTLVSCEHGLVEIGRIEPGQRVWTWDFSANEWSLSTVLARHDSCYSGKYVEVALESTTIRVTGGHPFWVVSGDGLWERPLSAKLARGENEGLGLYGRWVDSHELRPGDAVYCLNSHTRIVTSVEVFETVNEAVCNLTIQGNRTFAVANEGILVHNTGWCDLLEKAGKLLPDSLKGVANIHGHHIVQKTVPRQYKKVSGLAEWEIGNLSRSQQMAWYIGKSQERLVELGIPLLDKKEDVVRIIDSAAAAGKTPKLHNLVWAINGEGTHTLETVKAVYKGLIKSKDRRAGERFMENVADIFAEGRPYRGPGS